MNKEKFITFFVERRKNLGYSQKASSQPQIQQTQQTIQQNNINNDNKN